MIHPQFAEVIDDFAYGASVQDAAGLKLSLSIFADRAHIRDQLREDAQAAGFRISQATGLAALRDKEVRPLGEVVLLDIPQVDGAVLAALARIDLRAAHAGAALVVSTSVDALDDVFGSLDQSGPQILVNPSRAERLIALGQVLVRLSGGRVRELSEEDRLVLLRLTEQVSLVAQQMERFSGPVSLAPAASYAEARTDAPALPTDGGDSAFSFPTAAGVAPAADHGLDSLVREAGRRCPTRNWCGGSSASASNGRATLPAISLPIPPGTCCLI